MHKLVVFLLLGLIFFGCTQPQPTPATVCGDGYCDGPNGEKQTCPADCVAPTK